jgi:DNA replication protein DnaC
MNNQEKIQTVLRSLGTSTTADFEGWEREQYLHIGLSPDQELEALTWGQEEKWAATPLEIRPESPEQTPLTEEERQEAFRKAREAVYFALRRIEYGSAVAKPVDYVKMTAEQLFEEFKANFEVRDKVYEVIVKNLCCYFARDTRFRGDLDRGLLLMGKIGSGKTTLMKFFAQNQNHSFRVVSILDLSFDYKMSGESGVSAYIKNFSKYPNCFGQSVNGYCFDELGTEEVPARHFGESKNIFSEILQIRYQNKHLTPFNSTHVTTNKNGKELDDLYGSRAFDRMKEMFNVINFNNESFRVLMNG